MTLVIGTKLPNGVLLVSDTREIGENTDEIVTELKRKITLVTSSIFLGRAGSESNEYTARILRNCLYNKSSQYTSAMIRDEILNLYSKINVFHVEHHVRNYPIGSILLAEYDKETSDFNLLHADGLSGFTSFDILNNIKDYQVIGSSKQIQANVKSQIEQILNDLTEEELEDTNLYNEIASQFHEVIRTQNDIGIGDSVYCTYLTEFQGQRACTKFYVSAEGERTKIPNTEEETYIQL